MEITQEVLVTVTAAAVIAVLGALLWRPWRKVKQKVQGHGIDIHVEVDLARMEITGGVEAPARFWVHGTPAPPTPNNWGNHEWATWARTNDGHDVGSTVIQVTIQGGRDAAISVEPPEMDFHEARETSREGAVYGPEGLGGNGIHSRRFKFTLNGCDVGRQYFDDPSRPSSFSLGNSETQRLLIVVQATDNARHLWGLQIPVIHAGSREVIKIRSNGSPFITYGRRSAPSHMLVDGVWVEHPPLT